LNRSVQIQNFHTNNRNDTRTIVDDVLAKRIKEGSMTSPKPVPKAYAKFVAPTGKRRKDPQTGEMKWEYEVVEEFEVDGQKIPRGAVIGLE